MFFHDVHTKASLTVLLLPIFKIHVLLCSKFQVCAIFRGRKDPHFAAVLTINRGSNGRSRYIYTVPQYLIEVIRGQR